MRNSTMKRFYLELSPGEDMKNKRIRILGEIFCIGTIKDHYSDKLEKACTIVTVRSSGDLVNEGAIEEVLSENIEDEDTHNGNCRND